MTERTKGPDVDKARYIAVDGPISVGKTALAEILPPPGGATGVREDNPFISGFYQDPVALLPSRRRVFYLLALPTAGLPGRTSFRRERRSPDYLPA